MKRPLVTAADRPLLAALLSAPLIWALFRYTPADRLAMARYYDPVRRVFPLRCDRGFELLMHTGLKMAVVAVAVCVFALCLSSWVVPALAARRRLLSSLCTGLLGGPALVAALKRLSPMHCPWDIDLYGGYAPLLQLFERLPAGVAPGQCFPAGHASGGFALMAFYFALRPSSPRLARLSLAAALALGWAMGWAQTMRGAHFPSHTVWSAWVVWTFLALHERLLAVLERRAGRAAPVGTAAY